MLSRWWATTAHNRHYLEITAFVNIIINDVKHVCIPISPYRTEGCLIIVLHCRIDCVYKECVYYCRPEILLSFRESIDKIAWAHQNVLKRKTL